jgi:hypothetical protein
VWITQPLFYTVSRLARYAQNSAIRLIEGQSESCRLFIFFAAALGLAEIGDFGGDRRLEAPTDPFAASRARERLNCQQAQDYHDAAGQCDFL